MWGGFQGLFIIIMCFFFLTFVCAQKRGWLVPINKMSTTRPFDKADSQCFFYMQDIKYAV